jgi:hypothetical protein
MPIFFSYINLTDSPSDSALFALSGENNIPYLCRESIPSQVQIKDLSLLVTSPPMRIVWSVLQDSNID